MLNKNYFYLYITTFSFVLDLLTSLHITLNTIPKHDLEEYLKDYFKNLKNSKMFSCRKSENEVSTNWQMNMKMVILYAEKPIMQDV